MKDSYTIITGATGGIGSALCELFAASGYKIILACHEMKKAEEVKKKLQEKYLQCSVSVMRLDLANENSIFDFVAELKNREWKIKGLVNNASVLEAIKLIDTNGCDPRIKVNYVNTALLTLLILPLLDPRGVIVNTISWTMGIGKIGSGFLYKNQIQYQNRFQAYATSIKALQLFSVSLSCFLRENESEIRVCCANSGIVNCQILSMNNRITDLLTKLLFLPFTKTYHAGAIALHKATTRDCDIIYPVYYTHKVRSISKQIINHPQKKNLWDNTLKLFCDKEYIPTNLHELLK